jgi:hypothetical protein
MTVKWHCGVCLVIWKHELHGVIDMIGDWNQASGACHVGKFPSSSPCSQNLKGKTALNPLSFNINENCVQINYCHDM